MRGRGMGRSILMFWRLRKRILSSSSRLYAMVSGDSHAHPRQLVKSSIFSSITGPGTLAILLLCTTQYHPLFSYPFHERTHFMCKTYLNYIFPHTMYHLYLYIHVISDYLHPWAILMARSAGISRKMIQFESYSFSSLIIYKSNISCKRFLSFSPLSYFIVSSRVP